MKKEKSEDRPLIRYEKLSKEDLVDYCRVYWRRIHNDEVLFNEIYKDIESLKKENKKLNEKLKINKRDGLLGQATMEEAYNRITELEQENKKLKEKLSEITMVADDEKQSIEHILELEEENKKLRELKCVPSNLKTLIRIDKENERLEEENKKLKEEIRFLEQCLDNKEKVNKMLREELSAYDREYFDEDKKANTIFMEEDTLQELRDLGEI